MTSMQIQFTLPSSVMEGETIVSVITPLGACLGYFVWPIKHWSLLEKFNRDNGMCFYYATLEDGTFRGHLV